MKSPAGLGLILGVALTLAMIYYFESTGQFRSSHKPAGASGAANDAHESPDEPIVLNSKGFAPKFEGDSDLLAHRASLQAHISTTEWDRMLAGTKKTTALATEACRNFEVSHSVSVTRDIAASIAAGKTNVIFKNTLRPECFLSKNDVAIVLDDVTGGSNLYQIIGEAMIERLVQFQLQTDLIALLNALKLTIQDVAYLANTEIAPQGRVVQTTALLLTFHPIREPFDPLIIPPFVPGAVSITAENVASLFREPVTGAKPVLVDARDRRDLSGGPSIPGSVLAPITASSLAQLRFRMTLPITQIAGAKFEINALPKSRQAALVIYGNDDTDAAPLWVIRNLRLQNYRNIFYVRGGVKALRQLKDPVQL